MAKLTLLVSLIFAVFFATVAKKTNQPNQLNQLHKPAHDVSAVWDKRFLFFGHTEFSDILTGLKIVALSVDLFQQGNVGQNSPTGLAHAQTGTRVLRSRFEDALEDVRKLAPRALGMNEIYLLPSMYLLFVEENPKLALDIVKLGVADPRADVRLPLMAAYLSHVFLNDLPQAAGFYAQLAAKPGAPAWLSQVASNLQSGHDPLEENPIVKRNVCKSLRAAFPNARAHFEKAYARCQEAK